MARAPSTFRQQDVTRAIKAAVAAGVHIPRVEVDGAGKIGFLTTDGPEPQDEGMVNTKAATPGAAMNFLVALRALMRHALTVGLRGDDPTVGVRSPKYRSGGFYPWTEDDIAAFERKHPIGSRARLALALLLYTAQRRADVVQMGRQHVRNGLIHVRQSKTGVMLAIPLHPELRAVLDATPAEHFTFLTTAGGRPFHPDSFTPWFKRKSREAGLPARASVHRLRKAACRRLAELGCSANVIASI